jgi:RHS repeat-associated protein
VKPMWPTIRFPGQQFDAETDLFENWNRFYEPSLGRYLAPEPLLQKPRFAKNAASIGLTLPTYPYAYNNPIRYSDRNGKLACSNTYDCCVLRLGPEACGGAVVAGAVIGGAAGATVGGAAAQCAATPKPPPFDPFPNPLPTPDPVFPPAWPDPIPRAPPITPPAAPSPRQNCEMIWLRAFDRAMQRTGNAGAASAEADNDPAYLQCIANLPS